MMTTPVDARAFGALEAEVRHLREKVDAQGATLSELRDLLVQARGGWKVVLAVGAIAGALGASAAKILTFLGWR